MTGIKYVELQRYEQDRYKRKHNIYFFDEQEQVYCLPLMAILEDKETQCEPLVDILEKYNLECKSSQVIKYGHIRYILYELLGSLENLELASEIINKQVRVENNKLNIR